MRKKILSSFTLFRGGGLDQKCESSHFFFFSSENFPNSGCFSTSVEYGQTDNTDSRVTLATEKTCRLCLTIPYIPFRYISTSDGTNLQLQHQLLSSFITFKNSDPEGKIKVIRDLEDFKSENIGLGFQIVLVR